MNRKNTLVVVGFGLLAAATARADELPGKHIVTFSMHEEPGNPSSTLEFTITLYVTPIARNGDNVNWRVTKVGVEDFAGDRTWLDTIPTNEQSDWWITHAAPLHPAEAEFSDTPLLTGVAEATSGGSASLDYSFHTDGGSATYVDHAWWELEVQQGETCGKGEDLPVVSDATPESD